MSLIKLCILMTALAFMFSAGAQESNEETEELSSSEEDSSEVLEEETDEPDEEDDLTEEEDPAEEDELVETADVENEETADDIDDDEESVVESEADAEESATESETETAAKPEETKVPDDTTVSPPEPDSAVSEITDEKKELKVSVAKEEDEEDEDEDDEDKKDKIGINVGVNNSFVHNMKKDRPKMTYALIANAGTTIPKVKVGFQMRAGMAYSLHYGRTYETNPDESQKWDFDGSPLTFVFNRGFSLPWEIKLTPSFTYILPVTSRFMWSGPSQSRSTINAAVPVSRTFKLGKSFSLNTSLSPFYSYGWTKEDFWVDRLGFFAFYTQSGHTTGFSLSGSLMYKDFSANAGITYTYNIPYERDDISDGMYDSIDYKLMLQYSLGISYRIKGFNFGLSMNTAGHWRMYRHKDSEGGDRYLHPFDPEFTNIIANIGYNYSF